MVQKILLMKRKARSFAMLGEPAAEVFIAMDSEATETVGTIAAARRSALGDTVFDPALAVAEAKPGLLRRGEGGRGLGRSGVGAIECREPCLHLLVEPVEFLVLLIGKPGEALLLLDIGTHGVASAARATDRLGEGGGEAKKAATTNALILFLCYDRRRFNSLVESG
jgi:hypothetical protein